MLFYVIEGKQFVIAVGTHIGNVCYGQVSYENVTCIFVYSGVICDFMTPK